MPSRSRRSSKLAPLPNRSKTIKPNELGLTNEERLNLKGRSPRQQSMNIGAVENKLRKDRQKMDIDKFFNKPIMEEDEEMNSRRSRKSKVANSGRSKGSGKSRKSPSKGSGGDYSRKNSRRSEFSDGDDSFNRSNSIGGSSFKRYNSGNSDGDFDFDSTSKNNKWKKLEFPKSTLGRIFFILFFPTFFVLWIMMPDIKNKPDVSKVMLISILMFIFSAIFGYFVYQLEANLILAWELKTEIVGLANGFLLSIG